MGDDVRTSYATSSRAIRWSSSESQTMPSTGTQLRSTSGEKWSATLRERRLPNSRHCLMVAAPIARSFTAFEVESRITRVTVAESRLHGRANRSRPLSNLMTSNFGAAGAREAHERDARAVE